MDFLTFSRQARQSIYNLNIDVCMYERETTHGVGAIVYRLKVEGMSIGASALICEADSGQECINNMVARVIKARRQHRETSTSGLQRQAA